MSEAALAAGDIVADKYAIIEPIGVGGSATVYRAKRMGMAHEVALKLMHAEHPDSDNERQRFAREAEMVMKLQHPHVVPLLDYGHSEDGVPFLVFALLHGQSLERKIKTEGSLPWATAGRLSVQVLRALEKAHGLGVVHRDIKPANIFLANGVLGEVAQVLDFGLARMVRDDAPSDLTQAGALLGTPRYMAPEQVRGEQITHAADIYSFGLVMAEMLIGRPLVDGVKELDIYVAQGSDKPIFLPDEVLTTPFGSIIQRAVSKPVEVRYSMAAQMLADVQAALANLEAPLADVEPDLEATRMLDPSLAPKLVNPHAEKMRRVLNAAANKAAANKAAEAAARPPGERPRAASAQLTPTAAGPPQPTAGRPPAIPRHGTAPLDGVVAGIEQSQKPSPQYAAAVAPTQVAPTAPPAGWPRGPLDSSPASQRPVSQVFSSAQAAAQQPSSHPMPSQQPSQQPSSHPLAVSSQQPSQQPVSFQPPQAQAALKPTTELPAFPTPAGAPWVAEAPPAQAPPLQPPVQPLQPAPAFREAPRKSQAGLVVALLIVIVLILGGVGAILWFLGFIPI